MTDKELIQEMARVLRNIPYAVDDLNDAWGREDNEAEFEFALAALEQLMAAGKILVEEAQKKI